MSNVLYLNSWLDCPDLILRRNYAMQDKINEARNYFFYKCREDGMTKNQTLYNYQIWIERNRSRIKVLQPLPES